MELLVFLSFPFTQSLTGWHTNRTAPQNHIKHQAHEHPRFRALAARYGQVIHQINMRAQVALLRNPETMQKLKEQAEAPTVKTKEQVAKEEELKAKYGTTPGQSHPTRPAPLSVWRRKFKSLPENKAVDLFAEVVGDAFILMIASSLIVYEYYRSSQKPDPTAEKINEINQKLEELHIRERELAEAERKQRERVEMIETALRAFKDPKTKLPLLPTPTPTA